MSASPLSISSTVQLPEGIQIPQLGFGVYLSPAELTTASVTHALHAGYRHIDTAQIYRNEKQVGDAVRLFLKENEDKVRRQDVWITTKLRDEKGRLPKKLDNVPQLLRHSVDVICRGSKMEGYVDLFLIHSPYAGVDGRRLQWQALEDLKKEGKVRAIGVSNYGVRHLQELKTYAREPIAVNQIELHPWCQQREIVAFCSKSGIALEAYSPLAQGKRKDDPVLRKIAEEVNKSWAQVLIRWSLQHGFIPLPKSDTPERIVSNKEVYDFALSASQMARLDSLDEDDHVCWNPTECP